MDLPGFQVAIFRAREKILSFEEQVRSSACYRRSGGTPAARLTQGAKETLDRLAKRAGALPAPTPKNQSN